MNCNLDIMRSLCSVQSVAKITFKQKFRWYFSKICSFRSPYPFYLLTAGVEVVYFHLITLRHTPESVGLLWTRDRPVADTSTSQHKHCTRDKHSCPRWVSNPRSQQALGRKLTPFEDLCVHQMSGRFVQQNWGKGDYRLLWGGSI
jgi:hypothetical protein